MRLFKFTVTVSRKLVQFWHIPGSGVLKGAKDILPVRNKKKICSKK